MCVLASGGALLLFGPRPHERIPQGRVVVHYWEKWSGREAEAMRSIVDEFNNSVGAQKGIYVDYLSVSNVQQRTLAATAAGIPPDVAGLFPAQVVQFATCGAAIPLDELAAAHQIRPADYKRVFWEMCAYRGQIFALPTTPAVVALHYNKRFYYEAADTLRGRGLDPTSPPRTLAEFDQYAEALDVYAPGRQRLARAGYFTMDSGWYITYTELWFGGRLWDSEAQRYTVVTPQNVAAFEWIASYSRRMGAAAFVDFQSGLGSFNSPTNPFISGAVAMVMQGPWTAQTIRTYRPDMSQIIVPFALEPLLPRVVRPFNYEWGVAAFPSAVTGQKDVTYCETDLLMIPRGAKHPREAFEFIAYCQRREVMEKLCRLTCKNSPLRHQSDDWVYTHPNPYVDVFDRLAASPNAHSPDQTPIYNEALNRIDVAAQQTYLLQKSAADALTEAQVEIDARLAGFNELQARRDQYR